MAKIVSEQHPGASPPEEIIAAIDGEAPPEALARLRATPAGAAELDDFARLQRRLQLALHRIDCPDPDDLGEYVLGLLAPGRRTAVAAHLLGCPRCADEVADFRTSLGATALAPVARAASPVRRLIASLFTPAPGPAAALRGGDTDESLTFRADDVSLTIDRAPVVRRGQTSLAGLIWRESEGGPPLAGSPVHLTAADGATRATTIDDLGNFAFDNLAVGTYQLEVVLGDTVIAIDGLAIGR